MANLREGGDITAADMAPPPMEPSRIQEFFAGSTVLVTGATGFLGRLLVEKLLRTCRDVAKIYLVMRAKKEKTPEQRFREYFDDPLYERLKREYPEALEKIATIEGDCALEDLGICERDRQLLIAEVNCVFHVAATVRFDEKLRTAVYINIRATRDILRLSRKIKELRSIVYVSTAFSFCPRRTIDEEFYEPSITANKLLTLVEILNDNKLEKIVPTIIEEWPNTYAFTKSVAENVVQTEGVGLPVAIVRPSIVVATAHEPVAGWINNFYGATGIFVGASLGLIRTMHCEVGNLAEIIPADYVVNTLIASAWDIAKTKGSNLNLETTQVLHDKFETDIPIYNYVSAPQKPITWRECMEYGSHHVDSVPSPLQVWHYMIFLTSNKFYYLFLHATLHLLPAHIVDFCAFLIGKKPQMVKGYNKIAKFLNVIAYFSMQQWIFRNRNTQALWGKLNEEDKKAFEFNVADLDWDLYFHSFTRGGRVYLVKDPLETVPQGHAKRLKLKIAHYLLVSILLIILYKLVAFLCKLLF